MRNTKVNKKNNKKRIYNKIKRYLKGFTLLGATLTSILYILYIIIISMYKYLYNRPIRTAVLLCVISVLFMVYDTVQDNKRKIEERKTRQATRQINR